MPTARAPAIAKTLSLFGIILSVKDTKSGRAPLPRSTVYNRTVFRALWSPVPGSAPASAQMRPRVALLRAWRSAPLSGDGVQHDHRDLALGLALVIGVGRPELQRL